MLQCFWLLGFFRRCFLQLLGSPYYFQNMIISNHKSNRPEEWFRSSLGRALLEEEREKAVALIPSGYYPNSLQCGMSSMNFLRDVQTQNRFVVDQAFDQAFDQVFDGAFDRDETQKQKKHHDDACGIMPIVSRMNGLPFAEKTHDLIVLPHTLDFAVDPHEVLRQVSQILNPQGCVVIIGFNLFSIYGLIRGASKSLRRNTWHGSYFGVSRIQDWLNLLEFDLVGARMAAYRPPIQNPVYREKLAFLESVGDRWWPGLGGIYIIVGRKKEFTASARPALVNRWRSLLPGIARPAASQRAARTRLKLVAKNGKV